MKFLDYLKNKFATPCPNEGILLKKSPLSRSGDFIQDYKVWLSTEEHQSMVQLVIDNYYNQKKMFQEVDEAFCFVLIPGVNGMTYVYNPERWTPPSFSYLQEFIKERLMEIDYELTDQAEEVWQYESEEEKIEKYQFTHKDKAQCKILLRVTYSKDSPVSLKWCSNLPLRSGCSFKQFEKQIQQLAGNSL